MSESFYGLSPYNYVLNNPVNYTDPTGMYPNSTYMPGSMEWSRQWREHNIWVQLNPMDYANSPGFGTPEWEYLNNIGVGDLQDAQGEYHRQVAMMLSLSEANALWEASFKRTIEVGVPERMEGDPPPGKQLALTHEVIGGYPGQAVEELFVQGIQWIGNKITDGNMSKENAENVSTSIDLLVAFFSKGKKVSPSLFSNVAKGVGKNFSKISDNLLKKSGIDAHQLKREWLGDKAKVAHYDLYKDTKTGEILILQKGGKGTPIQTGEFIK